MRIIKGKIPGAKKVVLYGPEGIGKSTFASQFPEPLFIDTEGSTKNMDVARLSRPTSYAMLLEEIQYIKTTPNLCKTLVIDTADWAEQLCVEHICAKHDKSGIEDFGYGNGYVYIKEEFGRLLNRLEDIVEQGIHVVITAHAQIRKFEQPDEMGAYDRWELKLGKKTQSQTSPLVKEWADMLLFANYKTYSIAVDDKGKKRKAQGGKRMMYTTHHPCWDAKNRYALPEECELSYENIRHVVEEPEMKQPAESVQLDTNKAAKEFEPLPDFMRIPKNVDEEVDFFTDTTKKVPEAFKLPESIPYTLRDLMEENLVSEEEIQTVVAEKGYFPKNTPIQNYPEEFINGVLVGAWAQVYQCIKNLRETYKTPFDK